MMANWFGKVYFDRRAKVVVAAGSIGLSVVAVAHGVGEETNRSTAIASNASELDRKISYSCAVTLDHSVLSSFTVGRNASVNSKGCRIQSNSQVRQSGELRSKSKNEASGQPKLQHDEILDPMENVPQPVVGDCDHQNVTLKQGEHVLTPGVYCGGIVSLASSVIKMKPGIYIMKNGPLYLSGGASLIGNGVAIYLQGAASVFGFGVTTSLKLTAPETGPLAGILVFEDRNAPSKREFVIRSFNARMLEGLIYLPKGRLVVDNGGRVGHEAKWTSIIAHQIEVRGKSEIQLNSNYAQSIVPVPQYLARPPVVATASAKPL